jgi:hypothetical protein
MAMMRDLVLMTPAATPAAAATATTQAEARQQITRMEPINVFVVGGSHVHDWWSAQSISYSNPVMLIREQQLTCVYISKDT